MTTSPDYTEGADDTVRADLRLLLAGLDPVPSEVLSAAKGSFTWRTIDAELAELAYDSLLSDELVGTRGASNVRSLSFEYGSTSFEIEVEHDGSSRRLVGQIAPSRPTTLELHCGSDSRPTTITTDDRGRFSVPGIAPGAVRFFAQFAPGDGPSRLLTEWMSI